MWERDKRENTSFTDPHEKEETKGVYMCVCVCVCARASCVQCLLRSFHIVCVCHSVCVQKLMKLPETEVPCVH